MSERSLCSEDGCDKPHYARGLCRPHYERAKKMGDVVLLPGKGRPREEPALEMGDEEWAVKPERTEAEVKALMLKRAYEFLNDPKTPKDVVVASMRIAEKLEAKGGNSELIDEMRKLRDATGG